MKLEKVTLRNIRQFVGTQEVEFSTDQTAKITLFRAPNTTGKTTLLNAVFWCLYGEFLTGFEDQDRLRSIEAKDDHFSVEVRFQHRGKTYVAKREGRDDPNSATFQVLEEHQGGTSIPHRQPDLLINSILPKSLASFFFFAGEYLKQPISGEYSALTTESIRAVLGFTLGERAIADLKDIRKKRQKELQTLSAGTDLASITEKLAEKETYVELTTSQLVSLRNLVNQLEGQRDELDDRLRGFESSSVLQAKREKIEGQLRSAQANLVEAHRARQQLVEQFGPTLFLKGAAETATSFIDDAVTKKRIPSPFDKTFVKDILESQTCVCGRPIHPGSSEYHAVASLINSATDETVLKRALAVRGVAEHLIRNGKDAQRHIRMTLSQHHAAGEVVENLEQELAIISEKIARQDQKNVRDAEAERARIGNTLLELNTNRKKSEDDLSRAKVEVERLKQEQDRAQAASPQVAEARTKLELLELLISYLESELKSAEEMGIQRIAEALNNVVGRATRQKYAAEVTTDYTLRLFKDEPDLGKVPVRVLSSGERRLLILCFMSALVSVCRERESEHGSVLLPGAIAPMMVDAPFGELDPEYQALAATTMMQLSDQLILMLSKTHYTAEVHDAIGQSVGKEYMMIGYKRGDAGDAAPVRITINDMTYDQIVYGADKDWTEIRSIGGKS